MGRPTVIAAGTVAVVVAGLGLGVRVDNLHNGLLAVSLALVGAFVLHRRPGQREARLFVAAGAAQSVVFVGRQVGTDADPPGPQAVAEWVAWVGTWPLPLVLVLVGATIMCFPDGRFPGRAWRVAFRVMAAVGSVLAVLSALWPVDYDRAALVVDHPLALPGADVAASVFDAAQPACFTSFQLVWLACVVHRWVRADADEARQLRWLVTAVAASVVVLVAGLAADGSPAAGLLTVPLIPVAAGIAIVESSYESLVREVRSSASRLVTAQDDARRRIERDLHDGAQHRLVVLGMELGRLVERAERTGDPGLAAAAQDARQQLMAATTELRELARGIHPSVLTQDGLASALDSLADRSPLPVHLSVDVPGPSSPVAEATVYFIVSEGLTNAARHSGATQVTVSVVGDRSVLRLELRDDGRGGAVVARGLRGVADRVASLGGHFSLASPAGGGTHLVAEVPCA